MARRTVPKALLPALAGRRSLRAFAPDPPDDERLRLLFEAARWAPSGGNGQPWRFLLARRGTPSFEVLADTLTRGNRWARQAPILILSATRKEHVRPDKPRRPNRLALFELGLAVGNLLAQATELGMMAHPMAGFDREEAASALAVPAGYETGVLVAVGYPGNPQALGPEDLAKDRRPRVRRPLEDLVFEGTWERSAPFARSGQRDDEASEG